MAYTDINPDVVAEIASKVAETLSNLNDDFDSFQNGVLSKIEESWYNDNALKVMPDAVSSMNKLSSGVNDSLSSLGKALIGAANAWAEANGAGGYSVPAVASAPKTMSCLVQNNKGGFEGMDVDIIQTAINQAETVQTTMIGRLSKLEAAGNTVGFRGGNMQAQLSNVCNTLKSQINSAVDSIIENITTNTGTAKGNVESARSATESTFTIN